MDDCGIEVCPICLEPVRAYDYYVIQKDAAYHDGNSVDRHAYYLKRCAA